MSFLDALPAGEQEDLRRRGVPRFYPRGSALFHERQDPDKVHLITSGDVKVIRLTEQGREVVLAIRGPGDILGELSAIDGLPRSAGAIALTDVDARVLPLSEFQSFLDGARGATRELLRLLSERLRDSDRTIVQFTAHDTVGRLAARLLELGERYGEETDDGVRIALPVSQEELAGWIGASRESVVKALQSLRELGWIDTGRRSLLIRDQAALEQRAM